MSQQYWKTMGADRDNLCHQVPVTEPESTDRPEISGLSVVVRLVELGGIEPPSVEE